MRPPRRPRPRPEDRPIDAFVQVRCLCGKTHTHLREPTLEGLGLSRWKCGACKRRYVIACTPGVGDSPETFWPLFLENIPSTGETRQEGLSTDGTSVGEPPTELHFRCRCGCRLVGKSTLYGQRSKCPRCASQLVLTVGYDSDGGRPVPLLEYPEVGESS
ncbi:MAG TPA: hypothetical protein VMU54_13700 [Planctomycetota bacterium]|nr:hypothetical protein [Planctomycetota bacterium]